MEQARKEQGRNGTRKELIILILPCAKNGTRKKLLFIIPPCAKNGTRKELLIIILPCAKFIIHPLLPCANWNKEGIVFLAPIGTRKILVCLRQLI